MNDLIIKSYSPETFRKEAHQLADLLADELERTQEPVIERTINWETPEDQLAYWQNDFKSPLITDPTDLFRSVISRSNNLHSRGYMGHQAPPPLPVTALTAAMIAFLNNGMAVYEMGMAGNAMEKIVTSNIAAKFGFTEEASGIITSGGTLGNMTALLAARASVFNSAADTDQSQLAIMVSGESHYSIERAVRIMGLDTENIIKVPVNDRFQIRTDLLEAYYQEAAAQGKKVFCIIGCACSTSVGAYDDLDAIASFAASHNLWFHVDGAHGAPAIYSDTYRHLLKGIERSDSVVMDFHKMMLAPGLSTALIFRLGKEGSRTFSQKADYLWEDQHTDEWYNSGKQTFECTKPMSVLHTYTIMRTYGDQLYSQNVDTLYGLAEEFSVMINQHENFELACEPQSNIVCFRLKCGKESDLINRMVSQEMLEEGRFYIVSTVIKEEFYLRVTLMNPLTEISDLEELLTAISAIATRHMVAGQ